MTPSSPHVRAAARSAENRQSCESQGWEAPGASFLPRGKLVAVRRRGGGRFAVTAGGVIYI